MKITHGIELREGSQKEILPDYSPDFPHISSRVELDRYIGRRSPWHWHREIELFYLTQGALVYHTTRGGVPLLRRIGRAGERRRPPQLPELKIGLIGFGARVRSAYLPALRADWRVRITAVAAVSERTRQLVRDTLGGDVALYNGYDALLEHAGVDAVMIAVPDGVHQAALSAALAAGTPAFYEPPISHLREQIPGMIDRLLADYPCVREVVSAFLDAVAAGDCGLGNAQAVARLSRIGLAAEESKDTGTWAVVRPR